MALSFNFKLCEQDVKYTAFYTIFKVKGKIIRFLPTLSFCIYEDYTYLFENGLKFLLTSWFTGKNENIQPIVVRSRVVSMFRQNHLFSTETRTPFMLV